MPEVQKVRLMSQILSFLSSLIVSKAKWRLLFIIREIIIIFFYNNYYYYYYDTEEGISVWSTCSLK